MLYRYLTGEALTSKAAVEYLEAEGDGKSLVQEGTTLKAAVKALRKLGIKFKWKRIETLKTTKNLRNKMVMKNPTKTPMRYCFIAKATPLGYLSVLFQREPTLIRNLCLILL
jgi:hypothetical protein